ncbi:MAG: hypothetical protein IJM25_10230 [Eubacterium sp.]|nr:hypothetical protein [Eubacterium sp.]
MKLRKKIVTLSLMLLLAFTFCGCYASSFSALMYVRTSHSDSCSMSFSEFNGTEAFKMKWTGDGTGHVRYHAKLDSGTMTVYYDTDGEKKEWFTVKPGEELNDVGLDLKQGSFYIIVESNGKAADGSLSFELE